MSSQHLCRQGDGDSQAYGEHQRSFSEHAGYFIAKPAGSRRDFFYHFPEDTPCYLSHLGRCSMNMILPVHDSKMVWFFQPLQITILKTGHFYHIPSKNPASGHFPDAGAPGPGPSPILYPARYGFLCSGRYMLRRKSVFLLKEPLRTHLPVEVVHRHMLHRHRASL